MSAALVYEDILREELSSIMSELHRLVSNIQNPRLKDETWSKRIHEICEELDMRIEAAKARLSEVQSELSDSFSEKYEELQESLSEKKKSWSISYEEKRMAFSATLDDIDEHLKAYKAELAESPNVKKLNSLYDSMADSYEEMLIQIKSFGANIKVKSGHLKPINYPRNILHVSCGVGMAMLYSFVFTRFQAMAIVLPVTALFLFLEVTRRMSGPWNEFLFEKVFGIIARPHERHKTNGSTYMMIAVSIGLILFSFKPIVVVALLVLGLADPAASIVGKLWGKKKLYRNKSYLGTSTFFGVAFAASIIYFSLALTGYSALHIVLASVGIAAVGTVTELFSTKIDDNFSIPFVVSIAAFLML